MSHADELANSMLAPLTIGLWFFAYSWTSPMNHSDTGFLFYYPMYFRTEYQNLFCLGSWQWVYTLLWVGRNICNNKFSDYWYDVIVGSSMTAYISHYVFIVISSNFIVLPLQLSYSQAVVCNCVFTMICIFLLHIGTQSCWKFYPQQNQAS